MQKIIFDDLLEQYLDERGKIVNGVPVCETHSFGGEYNAKEIISAQSVENLKKELTKKTGGTENENN